MELDQQMEKEQEIQSSGDEGEYTFYLGRSFMTTKQPKKYFIILPTVKPVYKDHSRAQNVWSLSTGGHSGSFVLQNRNWVP